MVSVISGMSGDSGFDGVVGFGGSEGVMVSGGTGVAGDSDGVEGVGVSVVSVGLCDGSGVEVLVSRFSV